MVNITRKQHEAGEIMRLHVVDELNFYVLSFFVKSRPANAFFLLMKSLDLLQPMTFKMKSKEGKDFFSIIQHGGPVIWFYNKDNESELPEDAEQRREFFLNILDNEIIPSLQKRLNPFPNHLFYKPAGKGLQGGYFKNEYVAPKLKGGSAREGQPGFGKSVNF